MNGEVSETGIRDKIKKLLELAHYELIEPTPKSNFIGYPTSDFIACFLDAEEAFGSEFKDVFNDAVPDYKGNWEGFKKGIIEPRLDKILESLSVLKDSEESFFDFPSKEHFDFFSREHRVICNMALASALLIMYKYANRNKGWMNEKKQALKKCTKLLLDKRVPKKGWQYYFIEGEERYVHTHSTWLSLFALAHIPKEIKTGDLEEEIEKAKERIKDWLQKNIQKEDAWCFRPEELREAIFSDKNDIGPAATAQAILALHYAGADSEMIESSIKYIKKTKNSLKEPLYINIPTKNIPQTSQGIQSSLLALLISGVTHEDETVQYLSGEVIDIVDETSELIKENRDDVDRTLYYPTHLSLIWYLFPPVKPVKGILFEPTKFQGIFESFISGAKSLVLVGDLDMTYANLIPPDVAVTVFYRESRQDVKILDKHWKTYPLDSRFEYINCVIVDRTKALISSNPFREIRNRYYFYRDLKSDEIQPLIDQLENITGKRIPIDIKKEIYDSISGFAKHHDVMDFEGLSTDGLQGVLEYFKLIPERTEEALAPALGLGLEDRSVVEREFSRRGIFSRVFVNSDLKELLEKSIGKTPAKYLILDESSTYLLLNTEGTPDEEKVINCFSECLAGSELFVTADIHEKLRNFLSGKIEDAKVGRVAKIEDRYKVQFNELTLPLGLRFTEDEKIAIGYAAQGEDYGIITNSWEVVKMCKENKIKTFSLMKFLEKEKNENIYKIFRIPIDEFKQ